MPADLSSILRLEVPLSVQIASRPMRVREISALSPGAIIELPKLSDERLDVTIGGRRIGTGTAVKVGENFGVRILHVGTIRQRLAAMGPKAKEESTSDSAEGSAPELDSASAEGSAPEDGSATLERSASEESAASASSGGAIGNSADDSSEDSTTSAAHPQPESKHSEPGPTDTTPQSPLASTEDDRPTTPA